MQKTSKNQNQNKDTKIQNQKVHPKNNTTTKTKKPTEHGSGGVSVWQLGRGSAAARRGSGAWQWGVAVERGSAVVGVAARRGSVVVGAWQCGRGGAVERGCVAAGRGSGVLQCGSRGVAAGRGSGVLQCHGPLPRSTRLAATLPRPNCHTATPPLPHCHAPLVLFFFGWGGWSF